MHLGKQVVVEECSKTSDVHHAGRAWRVPHSDAILADIIRTQLLN